MVRRSFVSECCGDRLAAVQSQDLDSFNCSTLKRQYCSHRNSYCPVQSKCSAQYVLGLQSCSQWPCDVIPRHQTFVRHSPASNVKHMVFDSNSICDLKHNDCLGRPRNVIETSWWRSLGDNIPKIRRRLRTHLTCVHNPIRRPIMYPQKSS